MNLCFLFPGVSHIFMEILTVLVGFFRIVLIAIVIKTSAKGIMYIALHDWRTEETSASGQDGSRCLTDVIKKLSLYSRDELPSVSASLAGQCSLCHGPWPIDMVTVPSPEGRQVSSFQEISEFLNVISLPGLACLGHRTLISQVHQVPPLGTEEMSPLSRPHGLVKGHDSQRKIRVLPPEETETDMGQAKVTVRDPCPPNSPMDDHDILCHYPNPPERNQMLWVQIPHLLLYSCDPRASVGHLILPQFPHVRWRQQRYLLIGMYED